MKKIILLLISFLTITAYSQKIDSMTVKSKYFSDNRKLLIYTPWEYSNNPNQKFEVVYVFDAQARQYFDLVHSTLSFVNEGQFPMIVIGIVSTDRNKDFLPKNEYEETFKEKFGHLGDADKLLDFISNELVPTIDSNFRTLPKRIAVGHSNGASFITYCLLEKPNLFDAYISISPNFGYDKLQFVKRFKKWDVSKISRHKFYYMCNSNESWNGWLEGRTQIRKVFESPTYQKKFTYLNQDFSKTENHSTVFPIGLFWGLKNYFNYQYFNPENLIAYYTEMHKNNFIVLTPQNTNQLAYNLFFSGKTKEALKILLWANQLFPTDLNLFDSIGEMYQNLNKKDEAMKYYVLLDKKIEEQKKTLKDDDYKQLKNGVKERIKSLKDKK